MSTDYSQAVADILDALGDSPTPDEAYHATRNYDERYIAAALAASVAAAGGGGGSQPFEFVPVTLTASEIAARWDEGVSAAYVEIDPLGVGDQLLFAYVYSNTLNTGTCTDIYFDVTGQTSEHVNDNGVPYGQSLDVLSDVSALVTQAANGLSIQLALATASAPIYVQVGTGSPSTGSLVVVLAIARS